MAEERSIEEALKLAKHISLRAAPDEGDPITSCPNCGQGTFVVEGMSDDGVVEIGKCLHCGYERDYDQAMDDALIYRIQRAKDE